MLTRRRLGTLFILTLTLFACFPILATAEWTFDCVFHSGCRWKLTSGGADPFMPSRHATYYPDQSVPEPDPCYYLKAYPQPDPGPVWNGHDPQHGRLWDTYCPDALTIELNTFYRHVSNIFNKIGVKNRVEATTWAVSHGLGP